ncbi:MAG: plasmid pRiA4b ORF-3 family protein [Thermoguttaceae bacterium]
MAKAKSSPGEIRVSERVYQFKITLRGIKPPIWRRIQVRECALDELHGHIQTAMGWTNSHLHQFTIDGESYGVPALMEEDFEAMEDSTATNLSDIVPGDGKRFRFKYEYDFGDGWEHEILFEGCLPAEKGVRYPLCVEGGRACPPEDVGGTHGYQEYLEAMANPEHKRHKEFREWSGPFNPETFDAQAATTQMQEGLPDWRDEE